MKNSNKAIMIQGTGSDVGKSIVTCALCRIFYQDGFTVAPFKAQNMALNSFVTVTGGEIGRAQAVQAQAAGIVPTVDMNPVLMKPCSDKKAQIIVMGKPLGNKSAIGYNNYKRKLTSIVTASFKRLQDEYQIVVIEGSGSPAEVNLRKNDIVNMAMARIARSPVILVGDIDRGGVLAWITGTLDLLTASERKMVKGIIINKFRGDKALLGNAIPFLEKRTGVKVLGIIPYIKGLKIAQEDSIPREAGKNTLKIRKDIINIAVIVFPHISNFTDFDALENEADVTLEYLNSPDRLKRQFDVIILPGTKNTIMDFLWLKRTGLAEKILFLANTGVSVIGMCGGYQMLGLEVCDPGKVESSKKKLRTLGLLPITTELKDEKRLTQVNAVHIKTGIPVKGYEIHHGVTKSTAALKPVFTVISPSREQDGAINGSGNVWGTYIHGVFDSDKFRRKFINDIRAKKGFLPLSDTTAYDPDVEFDLLARIVRENLDIKQIKKILQTGL